MSRVAPHTEPTDPRDLAVKYDRLAWRIAVRNRTRLPPGAELEDLAQVCRVAVFRAALHWDRRRGVAFSTYAWRSALSAVGRFLTVERRRGLTRVGDSSTRPEVRARGVRVLNQDHAAAVVGAARRGRAPALADLAPGREPEPGADDPADTPARFWGLAVRDLSDGQAAALLARYRDGLTLEEAGRRMGLTKERVRQLAAEALERVRDGGRLDGFRG